MSLSMIIPPELYQPIYLIAISSLCAVTALFVGMSNEQRLLHSKSNIPVLAIILSLLVILFLGPRPVHIVFVDTGQYVYSYEYQINEYVAPSFGTEWLWHDFSYLCKNIGLSSKLYLLAVEFFYISTMFLACGKLMRNNIWVALLFCLSSFSCYAYATNGIRNGMGCNMAMLAIAFLNDQKRDRIIAYILMFIAFGIHRTTLLPISCAIASYYWIKDTRVSIRIWLIAIVVSLVVGNAFGNLMQSFDLFDTKSEYFSDVAESELSDSFSSTGFRWDFLLYTGIVHMVFDSKAKFQK